MGGMSDQWNKTSPLMSQMWQDFDRWNQTNGGVSEIRNAKQLERRLVGAISAVKVAKPSPSSATRFNLTRARRLTNLKRKGV